MSKWVGTWVGYLVRTYALSSNKPTRVAPSGREIACQRARARKSRSPSRTGLPKRRAGPTNSEARRASRRVAKRHRPNYRGRSVCVCANIYPLPPSSPSRARAEKSAFNKSRSRAGPWLGARLRMCLLAFVQVASGAVPRW